jgi:FAD/FMN-containing dehydrogenase
VLRRYRDYTREMPDALNVTVVVTPDAVAVRGMYAGGADDAWRALAPLFLAEPFEDTFRAMPKDTTRTHAAYTAADYTRLRELKRAYDPDNVFGVGHNIPPLAEGLALAA